MHVQAKEFAACYTHFQFCLKNPRMVAWHAIRGDRTMSATAFSWPMVA